MKTNYSKLFEQFWKAYPRKTAKATAFKSWQKHVDESDAFMVKAIVADIEKRTRLKWWPFDTTKIPHASTWLSQQRYLDEGWEDDIKTRGGELKGTAYIPRPPADDYDGHTNGSWMSMLNRLGFSYLLKCGGVSDALAKTLLKIKNEVFAEYASVANEEVQMAGDKSKAFEEMAFLMADTMLTRFDMICERSLKAAVINMARKPE